MLSQNSIHSSIRIYAEFSDNVLNKRLAALLMIIFSKFQLLTESVELLNLLSTRIDDKMILTYVNCTLLSILSKTRR